MASGQDPKVHEHGGYSDSKVGPAADSASWDKRTPLGGDGYRELQERKPEEGVYVTDETRKKAAPSGRLSRDRVRADAAAAAEKDGQDMTRTYVLAGLLGIAVIGLGIAAIFTSKADMAKIDKAAEAAVEAKPDTPEEVQGVRVRKGIQHSPVAPPKKPGQTIEDENEMPLNAVPDGAAPSDAHPEPVEPAGEGEPPGEADPAASPEDRGEHD